LKLWYIGLHCVNNSVEVVVRWATVVRFW
jgi:hypothetical protein